MRRLRLTDKEIALMISWLDTMMPEDYEDKDQEKLIKKLSNYLYEVRGKTTILSRGWLNDKNKERIAKHKQASKV
jgi:hypothetical protein